MLATLLKIGLGTLFAIGLADYAARETLVKPAAQRLFHEYLASQPELRMPAPARHFRIAHAWNSLIPICKTYGTCFDWNDYGDADIVVAASPPGGPKSAVRLLRSCDVDRCEQTDHPDVVIRATNSDENVLLSTLSSSKTCADYVVYQVYAARVCMETMTMDGAEIYASSYLLLEGQIFLRPFAERFSYESHLSADLVTSHRSFSDDIPPSMVGSK